MPYIGRAPTSTATKLEDADQDTKIQVEESSDEDTIRFDIAGAEDFTMTANTFTAQSGSTIAAQALTATTIGSSGGVTITGTTPTLTVGDAGAEDAKIVFDGNAQDFHIGLDDTADSLAIGLGSALGTTDHMVFDATGAVTKPLQPCVLVHPASDQSNIAVDSAVELVWGTERFDQNADFASNTFTAPVTGRYLVLVQLRLQEVDTAADYIHVYVVSSNKTYSSSINDYGGLSGDPAYWGQSFGGIIDMDASDTLVIQLYIGGGSVQTDLDLDSYLSIGLFA